MGRTRGFTITRARPCRESAREGRFALGGDVGALPGVAAGRALGASPRRNARESAGTSATDAATVPLMHNLVQQGAVEELARILLSPVRRKPKASTTTNGDDEEEKDATLATTTSDGLDVHAERSSAPSAGGVATVAELAARGVASGHRRQSGTRRRRRGIDVRRNRQRARTRAENITLHRNPIQRTRARPSRRI